VNRKFVLIASIIFIAASAFAQMNTAPGPELKKLDYFVGTWTTDATVTQGPWGMGGKFTSTGTSQWMTGNYFLETHRDFSMPPELGGDGKEVGYMGYDTDQNVYTLDLFSSQGRHTTSKGTVSGDTWTWNSSANYAGQEILQRMTIKIVSPTSQSFKFEISLDGKQWMPFMEGKATKK
jgi:Protein of unknown function (DUF1579)